MGYSDRKKLNLWVRIDINGNPIPGSEQYRPIGVKPKDGIWKQVTSSYCCGCNCLLTVQNSSTLTTITSIVSADGSINWTGTLTNGSGIGAGGYVSFVIPNCYDESIVLTFGAVTGGGIDINPSTKQGTGTATTSVGYIAASAPGQTATITTTSGGCAQYLIVIQDD